MDLRLLRGPCRARSCGALAGLVVNLADFNRSLEAERGRLAFLRDRGSAVIAYFWCLSRGFERGYVAAQAVGSGT